jgi:hypothetical protein
MTNCEKKKFSLRSQSADWKTLDGLKEAFFAQVIF